MTGVGRSRERGALRKLTLGRRKEKAEDRWSQEELGESRRGPTTLDEREG